MEQVQEDNASVLVVDDNPLIVNVLKGLFGNENYQVYCCSNGEEALGVLDKKWVDVIICDVMMPEMDGYQLHDLIREKPELSHIPFVFLTALGGEEVDRGKEAGADDYMVKPFNPRELLSMVRGKIKRSRKLKSLAEENNESFRRKIIHTLSHEFRTPLVAINTGTELLLDQDGKIDSSKAFNLLSAIQRGGQRLEKLVNDFMLMQQIEAGIAQKLFDTRARTVVMAELVEQVLDAQKLTLEKQGFAIAMKDLSSAAKVLVYEPQIEDILMRFIDNAVKFSGDTRELEVVIHTQLDMVVTEMRDRGIGIDVDRIREAIDVFGQIDRDKLEQQGGGFGLAISNRYATINGGELEFANRKGGGAVISLLVPELKE